MGMAFHHFQGGMQHCVVDGRGGLANTAAYLIHRGTAGIYRCRQVTLACRATSGGIVVGEYLTGHQNHIIAGLGRELHIMLSVCTSANLGNRLTQEISKQLRLQTGGCFLGLNKGNGNRESLSFRCLFVSSLQVICSKLNSHHVRNHRISLGIKLSILGLDTQFRGNRVEIRCFRGCFYQVQLNHSVGLLTAHGIRHHVLLKRLVDLTFDCFPVDGDPGFSLGHLQLIIYDSIRGLGFHSTDSLLSLIQQVFQRLLCYAFIPKHQFCLHTVSGCHVADILRALHKKVLATHPICSQHTVLTKGLQLVAGNRTAPITTGQGHRTLACMFLNGLIQSLLRLLQAHSAYVHASQSQIRHHSSTLDSGTKSQISCQHYTGTGCQNNADFLRLFQLLRFSHADSSFQTVPHIHSQILKSCSLLNQRKAFLHIFLLYHLYHNL